VAYSKLSFTFDLSKTNESTLNRLESQFHPRNDKIQVPLRNLRLNLGVFHSMSNPIYSFKPKYRLTIIIIASGPDLQWFDTIQNFLIHYTCVFPNPKYKVYLFFDNLIKYLSLIFIEFAF
jgi:hypothetical protein